MKIERLLVFGDIHGMWDKFLSAFEKVEFNPAKDMMVFLGDYLDRGEMPVPVMEWVLSHRREQGMVFLRGNHDEMLYDSLKDLRHFQDAYDLADISLTPDVLLWLSNGGKVTLKKIMATSSPGELLRRWLALVESLPLYAEVEAGGKKFWFMHADCIPDLPLDQQPEETLLWSRHLATCPHDQTGSQTIVLGHTPVQSLRYDPVPQILQEGRLVLMDTGSFLPTGKVSCLDLLSGTVYQSD